MTTKSIRSWIHGIQRRNNEKLPKCTEEFREFGAHDFSDAPFPLWHDNIYLRICMANLFEKHLGVGKSRITDEAWQRLLDGYKEITGEEYRI